MTATAVELPAQPAARRAAFDADGAIRRMLALADAIALLIALTAAIALSSDSDLTPWPLAAFPLMLVLFKVYGLYDRDSERIGYSTVDDLPRLLHATVIGGLLLWLYSRYTPMHQLAFLQVLVFGLGTFGSAAALRWATRLAARWLIGPERALLIGTGPTAVAFARKLEAHPEYRVDVVGALAGVPEPDDLEALVAHEQVSRIVVSAPDLATPLLESTLHHCRALGLKISVLPRFSDVLGAGVHIDDVEGLTTLGLARPSLPRSSRAIKRAMDVAAAGVMLLASAPVLLVLALAIKLDSRGPVLFRQERVGRGGRSFRVLKLRTMVADAEQRREALVCQSSDPNWLKLDADPRITRLGGWLRRLSLDELPQLWNVLRGEMSLVGPRPLVPTEDERVQGWARGRLDLTPGLTGYWQVLGRTRIPFEEMVKLDYLYAMNWSLWEDVRLMMKTLPVVLAGHGVN